MTRGAGDGPVLEVLEPGLLTTVQDLGRFGSERLGVPHAGACDRWGLGVANALLGNDPGAAALELTLLGPVLRARRACTVALGGADLGAVVEATGIPVPSGTSHALATGDVLSFTGGSSGVRAYLALAGGVDVPAVLGSRSTYVPAGLGGLEGRALAAGDRLSAAGGPHPEIGTRVWPAAASLRPGGTAVLRVVAGPDAAAAAGALEALLEGEWLVDPSSDRMGVRLSARREHPRPSTGELVSRPVAWGAVQVPPSGAPIVLGADHQTVGGYPVPAVVITADLPVLGQIGPGDALAFRLVTPGEAVAALRGQAQAFRRAEARLRGDAMWQDLWLNASG